MTKSELSRLALCCACSSQGVFMRMALSGIGETEFSLVSEGEQDRTPFTEVPEPCDRALRPVHGER